MPLTTMANLVCTSPSSPVTQVYNSAILQYEPDRTLTPTVIHPDVVANASDGSWKTPQANAYLADIKWLVNGVDISTIAEWQNKYEIDLVGATRGDIIIKRNIAPGEYVELSFQANIADERLGVNVPIKTDTIVLSTMDKAEDGYSMDIGDDQIIQYDPFKDELHRYEYKTSHGLLTASSSALTAAKANVNSYERVIPINLYRGGDKVLPSDYTVNVYQITGVQNGVAQLTELHNVNGDEILSVASDGVTLDLRMIDKRDYLIRCFVGTKAVAEKQFSVNRIYPKFTIRPTNGTSISPNDTERYDIAMVDCDGNIVDCPESIIKIIWKTDSASIQNVIHGEGRDIVFQLSNTGIGKTYLDDWLDVYCEGDQKPVHKSATGQIISGDTTYYELTDENGDTLIFN